MCRFDGTYAELLVEKFGYTAEEAEEWVRAQEAKQADPEYQRKLAERRAFYEAKLAEYRQERIDKELAELIK